MCVHTVGDGVLDVPRGGTGVYIPRPGEIVKPTLCRRAVEDARPYDGRERFRIVVRLYRIAGLRAADMFSRSNMVYRLCKDMVDTYLVK